MDDVVLAIFITAVITAAALGSIGFIVWVCIGPWAIYTFVSSAVIIFCAIKWLKARRK